MAQKEGQGVGKRRLLREASWYAVRPTLDSGRWTSLPCIVPWDSLHIAYTTTIKPGSECGENTDPSIGCRETSLSLLHHPEMFRGIMERNISEG